MTLTTQLLSKASVSREVKREMEVRVRSGIQGERASHWVMGTLKKVTLRLGERMGRTHRWQEWEEITRPVSKHHFFKYPNLVNKPTRGPAFLKMEFKIIIHSNHLNCPLCGISSFQPEWWLVRAQALSFRPFYSLSGSNFEAFKFGLEFSFPFLPSTPWAEELCKAAGFFSLRYSLSLYR